MASNICQRLINKVWRSYTNDLGKVPRAEGIYTIGEIQPDGSVECIYVGHANDMRRRLQQDLDIDEFVQLHFLLDNGRNLRIKWKEEEDGSCVEGEYLDCVTMKLGYWPLYNLKGGNRCKWVSPKLMYCWQATKMTKVYWNRLIAKTFIIKCLSAFWQVFFPKVRVIH